MRLITGLADGSGAQFAGAGQNQIFQFPAKLGIAPGICPAIAVAVLHISTHLDSVGTQFTPNNKYR